MNKESQLVSFRIEAEAAELMEALAERRHLSHPVLIEALLTEEALRVGLIKKSHRITAYFDLCRWIEGQRIAHHPDYTLTVFKKIEADGGALELWKKATSALAGERPEKRRQFINARIGRFCKHFSQSESDKEVVLTIGASNLIRGYTRFKSK